MKDHVQYFDKLMSVDYAKQLTRDVRLLEREAQILVTLSQALLLEFLLIRHLITLSVNQPIKHLFIKPRQRS